MKTNCYSGFPMTWNASKHLPPGTPSSWDGKHSNHSLKSFAKPTQYCIVYPSRHPMSGCGNLSFSWRSFEALWTGWTNLYYRWSQRIPPGFAIGRRTLPDRDRCRSSSSRCLLSGSNPWNMARKKQGIPSYRWKTSLPLCFCQLYPPITGRIIHPHRLSLSASDV